MKHPFTNVTAADLRQWTHDARRHGKTPNVAYFAARSRRQPIRTDPSYRGRPRYFVPEWVRQVGYGVAVDADDRILWGSVIS